MTTTLGGTARQEWSAFALRLTAFLSPTAQVDSSNSWWNQIAEGLPEQEVANPKQNQKLQVGYYKDFTLAIDSRIGRVDLQMTGIPIGQPIPTSADNFFPIAKFLPVFMEVSDRWLNVAPEIVRLAFGAQLGIPVESRKDGYKALSTHLVNIDIDVEKSRDLIYQINRPRNSTVINNLALNRVAKWSVNSFTMSTDNGKNEGVFIDQEVIACFLEMDMNTPVENTKIIEKEKIVTVFHELRDLGMEIATKGDIA